MAQHTRFLTSFHR